MSDAQAKSSLTLNSGSLLSSTERFLRCRRRTASPSDLVSDVRTRRDKTRQDEICTQAFAYKLFCQHRALAYRGPAGLPGAWQSGAVGRPKTPASLWAPSSVVVTHSQKSRPLRRFDFLARLPSMRNRPYGSRSCLATKRVRNQDKKRLFLSCKSFIMLHNAARINGYSDETEQKEKEQETSEAFSSSCILRLMF